MKKWIEVENLGVLFIEMVLVFLDYPVLFVVKCNNAKYLVESLDYEEGVFLVSNISNSRLLQMLSGKIDMYNTVIDARRIYYVEYNKEKKDYCARIAKKESIPDEDLPEKNVFFTLNNVDIEEYKNRIALMIASEAFQRMCTDVEFSDIIWGDNFKLFSKSSLQKKADEQQIAVLSKLSRKKKHRYSSMKYEGNYTNNQKYNCVIV